MSDFTRKNKPSITNLKQAIPTPGTATVCISCGKTLPTPRASGMCDACEDYELYKKVKDYVRAHEVNEWMVADVFDIPIERVKHWIKEGYLSYKDEKVVKQMEAEKSKIHGVAKTDMPESQGWRSS